MSQVLGKNEANKLAFTYQPRTLKQGVSESATKFVENEQDKPTDFKISPLVEETAGMTEMKRKRLEATVEESVLQRMKSVEEDAYKKAHELGLQEGSEKAYADTKEVLSEKLKQFDSLISELQEMKTKLLKENEVMLIKLALEIGKRIAAREIEISQEPMIKVLTDLVEGLKHDERAIIRLSKSDFEFFEDLKSRADERVEFLQNLKLTASSSVEPGGCILETNFGSVDSTVAERTDRVFKALLSRTPDLRNHNVDLKETAEDKGSDDESES